MQSIVHKSYSEKL
jgi:hypothetical protein